MKMKMRKKNKINIESIAFNSNSIIRLSSLLSYLL